MNRNKHLLVQAVKRALGGLPTSTAAGAGMLLLFGGVAVAAEGSEEAIEEVVVTGIRASIATAVSMKERSDDIIEAISAEDLGKLPDLSIADSLARLPGLTAQRTDGRSNFVSIRGFAPDFSGTTLSGREQASTGENRGVEFDQYPAELINAVEVYKTPDASLIGQGLAGTVNLSTIKPLNSQGLKLAVNLRGEYNSNKDLNPGQGVGAWGSRASFSVVDQFLDHTLGIAFGVARLDSPVQEKQYQAWWWGQNNGPPGSGAYSDCCGVGPVPGDPDLALSEEGMQIRAKSQGSVRTGAMGVLEWAPNESFHSELDLFFSTFEEDRHLNGLQWSSGPWDGISYRDAQTTPQASYTVLTGGTLDGIKPILQNEFTNTVTHNFSVGWNNSVAVGGWTFITDLSYSSARASVHDAYTFTGPQSVVVNGIGFRIPVGAGYPTFTLPAGVDLSDPSQMGFTDPDGYGYDGRVEYDHQTDTIKAARVEVRHSLGWIFKDVLVGFDWSERRKEKSALVNFAYLNGNGCDTSHFPGCAPYVPSLYAPVDASLLLKPTSLGYAGVRGILDYNVLAALDSQFYQVQNMGVNDYNRNYSIDERVPLGYLRLDIDTSLARIPLRGNVGVQFVHTSQSSEALLTDPGTGQPSGTVSGGTAYNEVLPSLNLVAQLADRTVLRLAAAKTMMRGRIDDEKAASSAMVAIEGPPIWSGSGGNPRLKPYIAIGEDLSLEKVFGRASYFSLALFNKNLTTYIFNQTGPYDFSGFVSTGRQPQSNIGTYTTPQNGSGGKIQGYEIALSLEGGLFAGWLDGFGLQSNFAYTNNYLPPTVLGNVLGSPTTFPGLSKRVAALTLYYEKHGFSLRVAETYRSDFTGEIIANFDQLGYTQIAADKTTNLQAGYEFTEGPLNGLSLLLQINNLTDSPYHTVQVSTLANGTTSRTPLEYDTFGRTFLLGVNYKL